MNKEDMPKVMYSNGIEIPDHKLQESFADLFEDEVINLKSNAI